MLKARLVELNKILKKVTSIKKECLKK